MKKFLVRQNCEYSLLVEAETEDAALLRAEDSMRENWDAAWSSMEVDQDYYEPSNTGGA